jgi:integrase
MLLFTDRSGLRFLVQVDLDTLTTFRTEWCDGPRTSIKKLERMRAFFRFAVKRKWIEDNPAADLESPRVPVSQTKPYDQAEWMRILGAVDRYPGPHGRSRQDNARRLRAFVLFLRYSGLRIGDAVSCRRGQLVGDKLFVYTQKSGVGVSTILPVWVLDALDAIPGASEEFFFWTGNGKLHSAVGSWQRSLKKLFELANVPGGHAHRFRHSFAVNLLLAGVPLERVSVLLGHQSTRITERHYSPWVRSRQEQLEADVRRIWEADAPLYDTPLAHEKSEAVN